MHLLGFYLGSRDVWQAAAFALSVVVLSIGLALMLADPQPEPARHGECPCYGCPTSPEEGQSCESR